MLSLTDAYFTGGILSTKNCCFWFFSRITAAKDIGHYSFVTSGVSVAFDVQANCRTWKSHRFWEVQFTVPAEGILKEILDVYCTIRIDADTGDCLEVATSAK